MTEIMQNITEKVQLINELALSNKSTPEQEFKNSVDIINTELEKILIILHLHRENIIELENVAEKMDPMEKTFPKNMTADLQAISTAHKSVNEDVYVKCLAETLPYKMPFQLLWKIASFHQELEKLISGQQKDSKLFEIENWGFNVTVTLYYNKRSKVIHIKLRFTNKDGSEVTDDSLNDFYEIVYTLVNQDSNSGEYNRRNRPNYSDIQIRRFLSDSGIQFFSTELFAYSKNEFVKNDSILIKLEFLPHICWHLHQMRLHEGILNWKIEDFHRKRDYEIDGKKECQYSELFYSEKLSYTMKGKIYLNGSNDDVRGKYISVALQLCKETFDERACYRNALKCTFTIIHPTDSNLNISYEYEGTPKSSHVSSKNDFAAIKDILTGYYLKEDTLALNISVQPLN